MDYGLKAKIEFAPTEDGDKAWALAQFMTLTASIGFVPTDVIDNQHPDWTKTLNKMEAAWPEFGAQQRDNLRRVIRRGVLLENSIVSVPANINALQQDVAAAVEEGKMTGEQVELVCKAFDIKELEVDLGEEDGHHEEPEPDIRKPTAEQLKGIVCLKSGAEGHGRGHRYQES